MGAPVLKRRQLHIVPVLLHQKFLAVGKSLEPTTFELHSPVALEKGFVEHFPDAVAGHRYGSGLGAILVPVAAHQLIAFAKIMLRPEKVGSYVGKQGLVEIERIEAGTADIEPVGIVREGFLHFALNLHIVRLSVNREDVHIESEAVFVLLELSPAVVNLRENVLVVFLGSIDPVDAAVAGVLFLSESGNETLEVRARHQQVYVIVPRDEALVAGGSDKCAVGHRVAYSVLSAERIDGLQYIEKICVDLG